ncbi:MAG: hypothetical protein ACTSP4_12350 [Candidatus Hodarchaeales archaeon]
MLDIKFDPFHIGLKLNQSIIDPKSFSKIKTIIAKLFKETSQYSAPAVNNSFYIDQVNANEILAKIDSITVLANNIAAAINVKGPVPERVLDIMRLIESTLKKQHDIARISSFYEIIVDIEVETNSNPEEIFKKQYDLNKIGIHQDESTNLAVIVFSSDLSLRNTVKWFSLSISPSPVKPRNLYSIKLIARFKSLGEVDTYCNGLHNYISNILRQIGDENAVSS